MKRFFRFIGKAIKKFLIGVGQFLLVGGLLMSIFYGITVFLGWIAAAIFPSLPPTSGNGVNHPYFACGILAVLVLMLLGYIAGGLHSLYKWLKSIWDES